ncbi:HD domain-containing protein [uncultured Umboniibacter sp.]|uniref:HD domain-containing protein n=1 Tax=uncultured Umboniibacter sp. TaxID=1798917 RepID=UPI0026273E92|nr:HD domain-containing protein [uncultured Umboniibacter sp.]
MTTDYWKAFEPVFIRFISDIKSADPAHDFAHIERVVSLAKKLSVAESADLNVVVPAAWFHDSVAVAKNSPDRPIASKLAADRARTALQKMNYDSNLLPAIEHAIIAHSYSANVRPRTLEARIVQDADRMDALGAVGVARCMLVGGAIGRTLYEPTDPLCEQRPPEDLKYTIDHFFTKLLHIGETMNTESAKREAKRRTDYMRNFLSQLKRDIQAEDLDIQLRAPVAG